MLYTTWRLFLLEWKKFKKYGLFRLLAISYLVLLPTILLLGKTIPQPPGGMNIKEQFFVFPTVWDYLGYIGNWLAFFFFGFMAVYTVAVEFSNKTLRQNVITGLSRQEFFMGKLIFMAAIAAVATAYFALVGFLIGFTHTTVTSTEMIFSNTGLIPRFFLMCMGYMTFGLLLALLIRRTGIAIFLYFGYIMFIELIIRYGIHLNIVENKSIHFYPMNAIEDLAPMPIADMAEDFIQDKGFSFFLTPTEAVITTLIYTSLFLFFSYRLLTRRDL